MALHSSDRELLEAVILRLDRIEATHTHIADVVDELKPEVIGIVERLQNNPMFKMFIGGK